MGQLQGDGGPSVLSVAQLAVVRQNAIARSRVLGPGRIRSTLLFHARDAAMSPRVDAHRHSTDVKSLRSRPLRVPYYLARGVRRPVTERLSEEDEAPHHCETEMPLAFDPLLHFARAAVARLSRPGERGLRRTRELERQRDDFADGWRHLQYERFLEAEHAFRAVLHTRPGDADASLYLGMALAGQGRHAEAITPLRDAASARPLDAEIHARLGISLREIGELFPAMSALREALRLRPGLYNVEAALDELVSAAARSAARTSPVRVRSPRRGARRRSHRYTRRTMPASSRELRVGA